MDDRNPMNHRAISTIVWLLSLSALSVGCIKTGSGPQEVNPQTEKALKESISAQAAPMPSEVKAKNDDELFHEALLDETSLDGKSSGDALVFNISTNKVSAREFFLSLGENTQYNMVVHPDVTGEISLNLREVTFPELVEILRKLYHYDIEKVGNSVVVSPRVLQTRIFQMNYLNLKRTGSSHLKVAAAEVSGGSGGGGGSSVNTSFGEVDIWREMEEVITTIIGTEEGRMIKTNPNASLLVVQAMPDELRKVERYLQRFQTNLLRQVVLEAKIIDVQLNDEFQAGINWSALGRPGPKQRLQIGQTPANLNVANNFANAGNMVPGTTGNLLSGFPIAPFGSNFAMAVNFHDFHAFIQLLQTQGEVQVLSSPRVSTVSNQKAMIKIGNDAFYVTDVSIASTSSNSTTSNTSQQNVSDVTLTPFFSGIALDVTPQINHDGTVLLHIHPTISEVNQSDRTITFNNNPLVLPLANSDLRESDNIVRARNGQVVVIGGLMRNTLSNETSSVPILGDIPVLGNLFRHIERRKSKSELVILIRPVIVDEEKGWQDEMSKSLERIKEF